MKSVGAVERERESYTLKNKEKYNNVTRDILENGSIFDARNRGKLRKNSAITLIALVITIVVLLILAGVTLNVIIGNNGILNKAKESKEKTEIAKYEEELGMCVLDLQIEESGNFNMNVLRSKFLEKVKENENTDDIEIVSGEGNATIEGVYKGYEFTIDEKYVVHIGKKSTGIRVITELSQKGYTNQNVTATIVISCNNGISTIKQTKPSSETEINVNGAKEYTITKSDISENTIYEYEITDSQGNKTPKTIEITTIDKVSPKDFKITAECINGILKITGTTTDEESGIARYEYYIKKSTDSEFIKKDTNEITGLSNGIYSVYAVAYDKAENSKKSNQLDNLDVIKVYANITAEDIAREPSKYYGLKVTNYVSANGEENWKIFYSDGEHIFLITENYMNTRESNRVNSNVGMTTSYYSAYWENTVPSFQTLDETVLERFKATGYELKSGNRNSNCVSTLLNQNNWKKYLDKENGTGKAEYAIGGATLEMWIDSWNKLYKDIDGELFWKTDSAGYYVGGSEEKFFYELSLYGKKGENNKLYNAYKKEYNSVRSYWLAAPMYINNEAICSISTNQNNTLSIKVNQRYGYSGYNQYGLRPVVSLKLGETVDAIEAE